MLGMSSLDSKTRRPTLALNPDALPAALARRPLGAGYFRSSGSDLQRRELGMAKRPVHGRLSWLVTRAATKNLWGAYAIARSTAPLHLHRRGERPCGGN